MALDFHFDVRIPAAPDRADDARRNNLRDARDNDDSLQVVKLEHGQGPQRVRFQPPPSFPESIQRKNLPNSLKRLEEMGWITRHMTPGSHKWYSVTIHNYKFVDDAGKIHILNRKEIKTSLQSEEVTCGGGSDVASGERSHEISVDDSGEASDRHKSSPKSEHQSSDQSEPESERDGRKKGSEQASPSLAGLATALPPGSPASPESQPLNGFGV